jgi:hypothetical protein
MQFRSSRTLPGQALALEHLKCCRTKAARRHFEPARELSIQMLHQQRDIALLLA